MHPLIHALAKLFRPIPTSGRASNASGFRPHCLRSLWARCSISAYPLSVCFTVLLAGRRLQVALLREVQNSSGACKMRFCFDGRTTAGTHDFLSRFVLWRLPSFLHAHYSWLCGPLFLYILHCCNNALLSGAFNLLKLILMLWKVCAFLILICCIKLNGATIFHIYHHVWNIL